jgi:uncharacterized membrane protein YphA (DoxX/SURF4 family)
MAIDRHGMGLATTRILTGVFFIFMGLGKLKWLFDTSILGGQLSGWLQAAPPGSMSRAYLERIAIPGIPYFARLVPLGEMASGLALLLGAWTPLFGFIAFFMALNFNFASGAIFKYSFLTNGYGLPVLASTLGLAIGGVRLPWSIRKG